jgi:predicted anti-sigma-YlaC factor YlaD
MTIRIDCKEVSRLISAGLDEQLPPAERTRLQLHFAVCTACRNVNEQMQFLRDAMRRMGRMEPGRE